MKQQRPTGLIVLCVLSVVWIGYQLLSVTIGMGSEPMTDEEIETNMAQMLEDAPPEAFTEMKWVFDDFESILKLTQQNYTAIQFSNLIILLLGLASIFMLFQLKKNGFYLYLAYSVISVGYWAYFYGSTSIGMFFVGFAVISGGIFTLLYWLQVKNFSEE